jgi:hypothetical protein
MAELKFDHTKDADFLETLGMSEEDLKELNTKFALMSKIILTQEPKKSELIEKIAETFSYNELILACTFFVLDKTTQMVKDNPMLSLLAALSSLKKED